MRVAVIDDMQTDLETLRAYLNRYSTEKNCAIEIDEYPSGDALLEAYRLIYDILIFDIDMPGTSGIDTARLVRERDKSVVILFVTNLAQYAINGYEVEAVDYIIKPISYYDFAMKFRRAVGRANQRLVQEISLKTGEGTRRIQVADIVYVEAFDHDLIYHVGGRSGVPRALRVRGKLKEHAMELSAYRFLQIHKSFMINLAYVEEIRANEVVVAGVVIPIGRVYKKQFVQEHLSFVRG